MFLSSKKNIIKLLLILFFTASNHYIAAQCFEIESILVDACGSPEGENEMVRFKVGSTALNTSNMSANFPTAGNNWLGVCQNGTTSNAVSILNNTIIGCGILIEPTGGILPANADVLLITSTAINASSNSFANLNDTIYVIFQCPGNTAGHFGNYNSSPGLRTLTINFSSPSSCSDVVTYERSNLINQNGTSGGSSSLNDGALANFDPSGNVSYSNFGCQAPISPVSISAQNTSSLTICSSDSINVTYSTQGNFQSFFWTGNYGNFSNQTGQPSTYYSSVNDTIPFYLKIGGITTCGDTIYDSLLVNITPMPTVSIVQPDTNYICSGSNITLNATGTGPFTWNNGSTNSSIIVSNAGTYYVSSSNTCTIVYDTVYVLITPQFTVNIVGPDTLNLCQGASTTLHANGATSYIWSNAAVTDSIIISNGGLYTVNANSTCPSNTDSVYVNIIPQLNIDITEPDTVNICNGTVITLHATGSSTILWSTGTSNIDSIVVNSVGYYFVSTTNSCFSDSAFIQINITQQQNITLTETDTVNICQGNTTTLHANGANSYLWLPSGNTDSITVSTQGTYAVYGNTTCPSDTDYVFVKVTQALNLNITEGNSATLCAGNNLTLHVTGGVNYIWNNNQNTDSIVINTIGTYFVESSNGVCPSEFDTINIINDIIPSAAIVGDTVFCSGESVAISATGNGIFTWSNGDIGSSTLITSAQQLILTATNTCGIYELDTIEIFEEDCNIETSFFIPNVFTPNQDDMNDTFKALGANIETFHGEIYNRWGELLFVWDNINDGWNGAYNNKEVPAGSYIYTIKVKFINNVNKKYIGSVLLLK